MKTVQNDGAGVRRHSSALSSELAGLYATNVEVGYLTFDSPIPLQDGVKLFPVDPQDARRRHSLLVRILIDLLAAWSITEPISNLHELLSWATMHRCAYILGACGPYAWPWAGLLAHSNGWMHERRSRFIGG